MKKLNKLIGFFTLAVAIFSFAGCSDISEKEESASNDGKAVVRFAISENGTQESGSERTVFPVTGDVSEFTNIKLSYKTSSYSSVSTEIGSWATYAELATAQAAIESGYKYFVLSAERYGATFTQTKGVSVTANQAVSVTFDSLEVSATGNQTGKVSVTLKFPSSLSTQISKVYAGYSEEDADEDQSSDDGEEITYDSENNSATFTKESTVAGYNSLFFVAKDTSDKEIFVYPTMVRVNAGYLSSATIDASTGEAISLDSSKIKKITYKINDASSTTADYEQTFYPGSKILSASATGFELEGKQLKSWNTLAGGTGTSYKGGDTLSLTADLTLYAIWEDVTPKTITYKSNYPSKFSLAEKTESKTVSASRFDVYDSTDCSFSLLGHKFTGWNTLADGTGTSYTADTKSDISGDLTLYAQWEPYKIYYTMNGGASSSAFNESVSSATLGSNTITSTVPTAKYSYYTFQGWATSSSATTATYHAGDTIPVTKDVVLVAVWKLGTIEDNESVTVKSSDGEKELLTFTLLKSEKIELTADELSGKLYFYIYNGSTVALNLNSDGVESKTTKTATLSAGTYTLKGENKWWAGSTRTAKITLKSAN
ncbi:MAG: InlB B-repeat-containing protein [Treponema sp.]|nr:InlB B-repeat-containing protein [Treponema sp.]